MKICFLDNVDIPYTSNDIDSNKIRGAENILINLSSELNNLGHNVTVINNCKGNFVINGVNWIDFSIYNKYEFYDLAITNNDMRLFNNIKARKYIAFSHSVQTIEKFIRKKQLLSYIKFKPKIFFLSKYHEENRNIILKIFGSKRINWAVDEIFLNTKIDNNNRDDIAIFTSREDRNLSLLVEIWISKIYKKNNKLTLMVTPSPLANYDYGIVQRNFGTKKDLINDLIKSKVFLAPGHKSELYCIAAEEARELCIPIVTLGIGALSERVIHGKTGFIAKNQNEFASYTLDLFSNISIWNELRENLFKLRGTKKWSDVANKFINQI